MSSLTRGCGIMAAPVEEPRTILTALDRCDWACGARAYKRWVLESGALDACAHHAAEASEKLDVLALYYIDEIWSL
jgi:hypothetical protein